MSLASMPKISESPYEFRPLGPVLQDAKEFQTVGQLRLSRSILPSERSEILGRDHFVAGLELCRSWKRRWRTSAELPSHYISVTWLGEVRDIDSRCK